MRYGRHDSQVVDVEEPDDPRALCVVLHGGFWRAGYGRELMDDLCADLVGRGYAVWNVEYRRLGEGGGWPATFDDVSTVLARAGERGLPIVTIGHSAGGQLALWAARLGAALAVSQAGVVDLERAWELRLSNGVVRELLGGSPAEVPERYAQASPAAALPLGVAQLLVHGRRDEIVPVELSRDYCAAAGAEAELVETDEGHFECLDPASESWGAITARLP